jgi:hypothetical protein
MSQVNEDEQRRYFGNLAWKAAGNPDYSREDIVYGIIPEFCPFTRHSPTASVYGPTCRSNGSHDFPMTSDKRLQTLVSSILPVTLLSFGVG